MGKKESVLNTKPPPSDGALPQAEGEAPPSARRRSDLPSQAGISGNKPEGA